MNIKTVVVLPGSLWQIPIIQKSKSMGFRTLVINPYKDSPAFLFADGHLQSDIFDVEAVVQYCKEEKADAVISEECDIAMPLLAKVGERLSLPALSIEAAYLFTDKMAMRKCCRKYGIPSPEYRLCKEVEEAENFFDELQKPAIIKPLDSNSSRGVFTIRYRDEIKEHFAESIKFSKIEKAVLIERYIDGTEFTVDGIKTPKQHFSLAISEKRHFMHNSNVASELYFTSDNEKYDYHMLAIQNDLFVNSSPLRFGLTHAEYKYENGKFYLIEIAARGGGNLISSHIVPFLSGIDNYQYLLECSLGKITSPDFTIQGKYKERSAVLHFFDAPKGGGVVERIEGKEILDSIPEIVQYRFNYIVGEPIGDAATDAERAGFYIACCESKRRLNEVVQLVQKKVKIICQ
jgi:biotin carboxylase